MRKAVAWIVSPLVAAGLIVSALAQAPPTSAAGGASTAPAPPAPPAAPHQPGAAAAAGKPATKSVAGTVKKASAGALVLVTTGKDRRTKEWTFVLDKGTRIRKGDRAADAKALAARDAATVSYREVGGKMIATAVTVRAKKKA